MNHCNGSTTYQLTFQGLQPATIDTPTAMFSTSCYNGRTVSVNDSSQVTSYMKSSPDYLYNKKGVSKRQTTSTSTNQEKEENIYNRLRHSNHDYLDKLSSNDWRNVARILMPGMTQIGFVLADEKAALDKINSLRLNCSTSTFEELEIEILKMAYHQETTKVNSRLVTPGTNDETATFAAENKTDSLHSINVTDFKKEPEISEMPANDEGSIAPNDEGLSDSSEDFEFINIDEVPLTTNSNINHKQRTTPWMLAKRFSNWAKDKVSKLRNKDSDHPLKVTPSPFELLKSFGEAATISLDSCEICIVDLVNCNASLQKMCQRKTKKNAREIDASIDKLKKDKEKYSNAVRAAYEDVNKAISNYEWQTTFCQTLSGEDNNNPKSIQIALRARALQIAQAWGQAQQQATGKKSAR
ncbi:MAG: hypothetical protein KAG53_00925 [Endozoicomonadaceae bacterium]|nr:hypothetical protein [Endozoicomonadaceae bacterium]